MGIESNKHVLKCDIYIYLPAKICMKPTKDEFNKKIGSINKQLPDCHQPKVRIELKKVVGFLHDVAR
jgi:hypothetical protein